MRAGYLAAFDNGQTRLRDRNTVGRDLQPDLVSPAHRLQMGLSAASKDAQARQERNEPSWQAVYDHWSAWSADRSLERVWQQSIVTIAPDLDLQQMNLDGSHAVAKTGGEGVAYQARKRAKTSNILPITDKHGYVVA